MTKSTITYDFLIKLAHQLANNYWIWGIYLIFIGIVLILCKVTMKAVLNLEWNFDQAFGNAVMVDHPSKTTRHEASIDTIRNAEEDVNSKIGNKEAPQYQISKEHKVSLLKKSGIEKYDNQDYQGALADFDAAYDIEPQCASILNHRAEIKRNLCKYEEALEDLNLANEIQPNNVFTLSTRGAVYKVLDNYVNALQDLDRADELDSNNYFVKTQRGQLKNIMGDSEGALVDLNHEANALNPHQAFVLGSLGVVHRELGHLDKALDYLNRAYNIKPNPFALRRRGVTRRELLDYQGSLEDLNMANTLEPYNDFTLTERGLTKKVLGDFQGALEDLTMANHIKADQAFTLKHRASANREMRNIDEALQDLSYADNLEPNDFFTLLELAMTKKLSCDYEGALIHCNKVVEMEPNDPVLLRQRGSVKRMLGDHNGALEDFIKADETILYNNSLPIMMERCFTKYAMKDVSGALDDAKTIRYLWGVHGQSSIKGEKLSRKPTTRNGGSSMTQKLCDIEKSTSCGLILWIEHSKLLFLKNLGRGSYGYVQKCKWVDKNEDVAVKYVASQVKDAFEYEVRMLANIRHPRVVRLIGCSYNEEEKEGLLVMELMQQNLRSLIDSKRDEHGQPFDLSVAVDIMYKIAEAMAYLHDQGVLHRDLKSSNVLVNKSVNGKEEYVVKIADLGMATLQGKNNMPYFMTVDVGSTTWRAPEVFKNDACQKYSFPADVWSYGMTCFEILTGELPFEGVTRAQLHQKVLCGLRPQLPPSCPNVLKLLVTKCWSLMPYDRPTFSNIHKILKLYLGRDSFTDLRAGDVIQPHELRRLLS